MFELTLRAADRLGTIEAFEKAFDIAVRMTNPLMNIPHSINMDINTTTYKRKGPATSTIRPGDTHRHDRVAVTSQATRCVKGRLQFDFTTTHTIPEDIPLPTQVRMTLRMPLKVYTDIMIPLTISKHRKMQVALFNQVMPLDPFLVEEDPNADFGPQQDAAHPSVHQNDMANMPITELSSDSEVRYTHASEQARAGQRARPADAPPRTDQDSDDDVVVLRVTPRARPPTRAYPINLPAHDVMDDLQLVGVLQNGQAVVEQDVEKHFWHLS
ncbi:hypothetical protein R1sor_022665 [Riccia sorocarpa]|uniref:Uncharacterized protein n=1 Tax=Riccia sorocarpa TaxID=122646 RepID=A0ABD3GMP0_9MARC